MHEGVRGKEGFTLVELLVALTVFAFGVLGVVGMQLYAIRGNAFNWSLMMAQKIAQQRMDYIVRLSYSAAKESTFTGGFQTDQSNVPKEDRLSLGPDDSVLVDIEDYGALMKNPNELYKDEDGDGVLDAPYDRFKRITIMKLIEGATGEDLHMVVKVVVYWRGAEGQHKTYLIGAHSL